MFGHAPLHSCSHRLNLPGNRTFGAAYFINTKVPINLAYDYNLSITGTTTQKAAVGARNRRNACHEETLEAPAGKLVGEKFSRAQPRARRADSTGTSGERRG